MSETVTPEIGMECTICYWSDCHPAKVISITTPKKITVKELGHKCIRGFGNDGSAEYEYFDDPNGPEYIFTLRKNGRWVIEDGSMKNGTTLALGHARYYYDPHF